MARPLNRVRARRTATRAVRRNRQNLRRPELAINVVENEVEDVAAGIIDYSAEIADYELRLDALENP
jgi:hypothetical protein